MFHAFKRIKYQNATTEKRKISCAKQHNILMYFQQRCFYFRNTNDLDSFSILTCFQRTATCLSALRNTGGCTRKEVSPQLQWHHVRLRWRHHWLKRRSARSRNSDFDFEGTGGSRSGNCVSIILRSGWRSLSSPYIYLSSHTVFNLRQAGPHHRSIKRLLTLMHH